MTNKITQEILKEFREKFVVVVTRSTGDTVYEGVGIKNVHPNEIIFFIEDALAKHEAELVERFKTEVIGEDPLRLPDGSITKMPYETHDIREELRAEQRAKLTALMEKEQLTLKKK